MLATATAHAAQWRAALPHCANLWVAVNLSPFQLLNSDGMAALHRILADPGSQPDHLILEITESALAADIAGTTTALNAFKHFGVRIAIDDFGTGYSSLSALNDLPVDILKIDRSFISGQDSSTPSVPMLEGILGLADKLALQVIAEGIEHNDQLDLLRNLGCRMGQGYLLSRPLAPTTLYDLLAAGGLLDIDRPASATTDPQS